MVDLAARVHDIVAQLGYAAELLEDEPRVSRWFGADSVEELSREEASVLAVRWVDELTAEGVIENADRLIEPLRTVLLETFRSAARTGTIDPVHVDEALLRTVLEDAEAGRVRRWIERKLLQSDAE